jgi:hypothetical protein
MALSVHKVLSLALLPLGAHAALSEDKNTSLADARGPVESNLSTPEGKAFDQQMEIEFVTKHLGPLRQCKQTASDDLRSFWILLKLNKDGTASGILLYPETKLATCARAALFRDTFLPPPRPAYWVSVYMKLAD